MTGSVLRFILEVSVLLPYSFALTCRQCATLLSPHYCSSVQCNLTECDIIEHEGHGICVTSVNLDKNVGHTIVTIIIPQVSPHGIPSSIRKGFCKSDVRYNLSCQCATDDCNKVLSFPFYDVTTTTVAEPKITEAKFENEDGLQFIPVVIGCTLVGVFISILVVLLWLKRVRKRKHSSKDEYDVKLPPGSRLSCDDASLIDGGWDESGKHSYSAYKYSSSIATQYSRGSRGAALNHNDQNLPIELQKIIGRGRFAEVWKAKLQQEERISQVVSVKVFRLRNNGAWRQEKEILHEHWMRHKDIIEFYASEQHVVRGRLQFWLITAYYQQGSLADFLRSNVISWSQFCEMALTVASGLTYLHSEMDDRGRPKIPIAHRDVKSCNILVKEDCRSCVLADFGLSLKLDPELTKDELSNAGQVGTSRYMAPELLERLVNLTDIEMFKRVDVYAMALVMWELGNRCEYSPGMSSAYSPPFGDQINDHPTKEQMLLLVCRERKLPTIPEKWKTHRGMNRFTEVLNETWEYEPESRITAGCFYERLLKIVSLDSCTNDVTSSDVASLDVTDDDDEEKEKLIVQLNNELNRENTIISTIV